ncbi:MAG TPA: TolC family protein [Candidatus Binataceae bacterium]|nr:TolC family protein [Candidatus Binataceae bacterium]
MHSDIRFLSALSVMFLFSAAGAQSPPAQSSPPQAPQAETLAQKPGTVLITLDQAIQMAIQHNHNLRAARTVVQQDKAEETTANLRPNPVLLADSDFLPVFQPSNLTADYLDNTAQWDLGVSYLFERGKKRQHRLGAAQAQTAVAQSQIADNERTLTFSVASQFINVELAESTLALATQDLKSFQNTVDIAQDRYKAGDIGEDDYLKIKLQLLQFQTDVSAAELARAQGLSDLRQLLGYESVGPDYDVAGSFTYQPVHGALEDFQARALKDRPDLQEAQLGVAAAKSQYALQKADGKRDFTGQINYTHLAYLNDISVFGQIQMPIFDRNQGEIARAGFAITQAQEQSQFASGQVMTDVRDAYENLHASDRIVNLYRSGYLDEAQQSLQISDYAYKRGAVSLLDFLDAERSYRTTQLGYRQALATYLLALEQLREAVGTRSIP